MKIVCCGNIPFAKEAFSELGDVSIFPERSLKNADVRDADMLIVRSTTKVNRDLLEGSRVKFVGTATIGADHLDTEYLAASGITWRAAPGCNANSVAEYIVSALLCLACRCGFELRGKALAVIGVGNVGTRVAAKAQALGMRVLLNDPPKRDATGDERYLPLDEVLAEADIVTLHVPLQRDGPYPTFGMANANFFRKIKTGAVFINSSRGRVMKTADVLDALAEGRLAHAVIDTWETEPAFEKRLLEAAALGTPHIAGYSFEGKVCGTLMIYREACRFLGIPPRWTPEPLMPPPAVPELEINDRGRSEQDVLWEAVRAVYDISRDDAAMRRGCPEDDAGRAAHFDRLRKNYPQRREFRFTRLRLRGAAGAGPAAALRALEFKTE